MKSKYKIIIFLSAGLLLSPVMAVRCSDFDRHGDNLKYLKEIEAAASSTVLLNNSGNIIPLKRPDRDRVVSVNINADFSVSFIEMLNRYAHVQGIDIKEESVNTKGLRELDKKIKGYRTVIFRVTDESLLNPVLLKYIVESRKKHQVIISITGNREILKRLDGFREPVIFSGINSESSAVFSAQAIFGGYAVSSKLDADISPSYPAGSGFTTSQVRLRYTVPEDAELNIDNLLPIDDIVKEAIDEKATPGAVVMVVKDGKVILEKSYGCHTYGGDIPVHSTDIYDLASVTKAAATTIAVMRLYEQGKIKLDKNISSYIPETKKLGKRKVTVRDLMLHQSGLPPDVSFGCPVKAKDFMEKCSSSFNVKAAERCFMKKSFYRKYMWPKILNARLGPKGDYVYSDLSMFYMKEAVERQSGRSFDKYLYTNFYTPLCMQTACFNPRDRFPVERIVPTEVDSYFRNTTLQGYVHDQCAAMMGGVAGHAGLFSDANDMAILFQMLLNRGSYGGVEYFKGNTVDTFTSRPSEKGRRALGFDSWDPESKDGYPSLLASHSIYGHTGFTGTCVWADPENKLIFIFLSNRTWPNTGNKLAKMNVRSRILDVIYAALKKG